MFYSSGACSMELLDLTEAMINLEERELKVIGKVEQRKNCIF